MKKYIIGLFSVLLFALSSYGQVIPKPNPTAVGIGYKRLLADSTLFIPTGSTQPRLGANNINRRSAIFADSTNKKLYVFFPDSTWKDVLTDSTKYVPYLGANNRVNLGNYGLVGDFTQYSVVPVAVDSVGRLKWDADAGTLTLGLKGGNVNLALGQESVRLVHNNTGSPLTDGQVVYITGSTGELPSVGLASASSEATSSVTYGMVTEPIPHGSNGFITTEGIVHGLNTNAFLEGKAIWLSDTAGNYRQYPPAKPSHQVLVGYVVKKAGGNGSIDVKIQNGYELNELHDVSITSVANNDGLFYESASSLWKNKTIAGVLGYTPANNALVVKYTDTVSMLSPYSRDYNTVHKSGVETITGGKFFNAFANFNDNVTHNAAMLNYGNNVFFHSATFGSYSGATTMVGVADGIKFGLPSTATTQFTFPAMVGANFTFPAASGTVALTSQIPSLSGYVQGSGTTNYISKFTGSGTIGNSALQDDGTNIGLGAAPTGYYNTTVKLGTGSNSTGIAFTQSNSLKNEIYSFNNDFYINSISGGINLATQSSTRAVLNNAGRFLVGGATDDGSNLLQVGGGGRFTGALSGTSATFSGLITGQSGAIIAGANYDTYVDATNANTLNFGYNTNAALDGWINYKGYAGGLTQFRNTNIGNGKGGAIATFVGSSGNVGIGTSSPYSRLDINGGSIRMGEFLNSSSSFIGKQRALNSVFYSSVEFNSTSTEDQIIFNTHLSGSSAGERMRITGSGNVLINQTSLPSASLLYPLLSMNGTLYSQGSQSGMFWENRSGGVTSTTNWYGWYASSGTIYLFNGSANAASISPSTGVYTPLSDSAKKKDFEQSTIGLDAIMHLKPTLFRMKTDNESTPKTLGFVAQEVKPFIPQAYVESGDGKDKFIGLSDRPIVAALTKAIQELNQKIDDKQTKIDALEARLKLIEQKLNIQ